MNSIKFFFLLGTCALINSSEAMQSQREGINRSIGVLEHLKTQIGNAAHNKDLIYEFKKKTDEVVKPVMAGKINHEKDQVKRMKPILHFYEWVVAQPQNAREIARREQEELEIRRQQEQATLLQQAQEVARRHQEALLRQQREQEQARRNQEAFYRQMQQQAAIQQLAKQKDNAQGHSLYN